MTIDVYGDLTIMSPTVCSEENGLNFRNKLEFHPSDNICSSNETVNFQTQLEFAGAGLLPAAVHPGELRRAEPPPGRPAPQFAAI